MMKNFMSYLFLLLFGTVPTGLGIWACYLPLLVALPVWGLAGVGISILVGAAWAIHRESKEGK